MLSIFFMHIHLCLLIFPNEIFFITKPKFRFFITKQEFWLFLMFWPFFYFSVLLELLFVSLQSFELLFCFFNARKCFSIFVVFSSVVRASTFRCWRGRHEHTFTTESIKFTILNKFKIYSNIEHDVLPFLRSRKVVAQRARFNCLFSLPTLTVFHVDPWSSFTPA